MLTDSVSRRIGDATRDALQSSLRVAVSTMNKERALRPSNTGHKVLTTLSGAVGGAFGLPALAIELPVATTIMLRSIADLARGEGENIRLAETQLACIEVFALGGHSQSDDDAETGYCATRAALAQAVSEAAKHLARKGLTAEGPPAIGPLISKVATRFQDMARAHFTVRRLERKYGAEVIQRDLVAWIIPKDVLSLCFSTPGIT